MGIKRQHPAAAGVKMASGIVKTGVDGIVGVRYGYLGGVQEPGRHHPLLTVLAAAWRVEGCSTWRRMALVLWPPEGSLPAWPSPAWTPGPMAYESASSIFAAPPVSRPRSRP